MQCPFNPKKKENIVKRFLLLLYESLILYILSLKIRGFCLVKLYYCVNKSCPTSIPNFTRILDIFPTTKKSAILVVDCTKVCFTCLRLLGPLERYDFLKIVFYLVRRTSAFGISGG